MVKASVIVPVFNRENLVVRCLDSILGQTLKPRELIVVDNASTDQTRQVVARWMESHKDSGIEMKLLSETRQGACFARQKGLENATGDYVIFFDSDDEMLPGLLEKACRKVEDDPSLDIVCWKCRINRLDGSSRVPTFMADKPVEAHLIHTLLRPQGHLVRKKFLTEAGGWSKPVKVWDDLELGLRLLLANPKIAGIPEVLAEIHAQDESITGTDFSSKEGEWEKILREMEKVNESSSHPLRKRIARILAYRKAILAAHYSREGNSKAASRLLEEALRNSDPKLRFLLRFSYEYTRRGLRGAWRFVRLAI